MAAELSSSVNRALKGPLLASQPYKVWANRRKCLKASSIWQHIAGNPNSRQLFPAELWQVSEEEYGNLNKDVLYLLPSPEEKAI